ncbi:MAG: hypothetical protein Ct9H300mP12_13330 [Acidimicrobiales bacterium]|nr:MAG: hypothetical protein Ct9H300mP12_13330 [Acidimicrobiales bacterium]
MEAIPEGVIPFNDVMVRTLFAEVWTRMSCRCATDACCSWA